MKQLFTIGRILYSPGLAAVGIHQLLLKDFRPEVLPAFPGCAHHYPLFPILTGIAFIAAAFMLAVFNSKNTALWLSYFFGVLIITFHLPYILFMNADARSSLAGWFPICQCMALCAGAMLIAGIPVGRVLFAVLMIVFGFSHFVYAPIVAKMVPAWAGSPPFWTYFVGIALIAAGVAFIFKIWIKTAGLLLAFMLFCFFLSFHIPDAIQHPSDNHGNEIVRAVIDLMYCGIALMIGLNAVEVVVKTNVID